MRSIARIGRKVKTSSVYGQITPLRLDRNFGNFPLARSARVKVRWVREAKRWWADLPGEDKVQIWFPANTAKAALRLLTGFDMNVLGILLSEIQRLNPEQGEQTINVVEFSTASSILKRLRLRPDQEQRDRLYDTLVLLSTISVVHSKWHEPGGEKVRKVLPPPLKRWEHQEQGYRLKVELDPAWIELNQTFYATVPMPLPLEATDQNLVLWILNWGQQQQWDRSTLARKAGIGPKNRRALLLSAIERAQLWFKAQGRTLELLKFQGKHVWLTVKKEDKAADDLLSMSFEAMANFEDELKAELEEENARKGFKEKREQETIHDPFADL